MRQAPEVLFASKYNQVLRKVKSKTTTTKKKATINKKSLSSHLCCSLFEINPQGFHLQGRKCFCQFRVKFPVTGDTLYGMLFSLRNFRDWQTSSKSIGAR
jgi:hypothetical protein